MGSTIPLERTNSPYSLNDALGDLSTTVSELDTDEVNNALNAMSGALENTPPELRTALDGLTRLVGEHQFARREPATAALACRERDGNPRRAQRADQLAASSTGTSCSASSTVAVTAISQLIVNISAVSRQLTGLVQDNEEQMKPTLDKLNSVVDILQRNKDNISQALDGLAPYATQLGESVGSGPFFMAYVYNIGIGNLFQGLERRA